MSSVLSVNVGLPQDIEWQGKTIHTAVWKRSVNGRVMARRLNLDGDGQGDLAGHGGEHRALMVYQMDSYRYWQEFLHRSDFEYGQFGENLTVEGLEDEKVYIGDRYRIGEALFEVTQPRVTCYRVGIRMNNPQMPSLLVSHRRPGFYFRVLEEGTIGAGDSILKVAEGPERVTVQELDGLLYLPGHSVDGLQRALRIPALSAGWRSSLEALADASSDQERGGNAGLVSFSAPPPAWSGFRPLRVATVHRESHNVLSFVFESEDKSPLPPPLPGQFVVLKLALEEGAPLVRNYSLSGAQNSGTYRISVKREAGAGSRYLHDQVKAGDLLLVSAPRGSFKLPPGEAPVVLLSAGIGVTPLLAMLHALAISTEREHRQVWWCHGTRNAEEHVFSDEVQTLLSQLPESHSFILYSHPNAEDHGYDAVGHVSTSILEAQQIPKTADFYLCGPAGFLADLTSGLKSWGVSGSSIHSETFTSESSITPGIASRSPVPSHAPAGDVGTGPLVSFTRSGLSAPWDTRYGSLLEFAEACDVPVRWSCRAGVCHMCESGLIDGDVIYSPEPLERPASGNLLLCCSSPRTAIELDL